MSYGNTKSPTMAEACTGKAKYQLPRRPCSGRWPEYYIPDELEPVFCRLYPITLNREMMRLFGISGSTLQRFRRERNLEKDMAVIRQKQAAITKRICEKNGYYESLRGRIPSRKCHEGYQQYLHSDRFKHPLQILKERNPRSYAQKMRRRSERRKEQMAEEKKRVSWGLSQHTNLHLPQFIYTRAQTHIRYTSKKHGYILGDMNEFHGERYTIYYDADTCRSRQVEANGKKKGFTFKPLPEENNN